MQSRLAESLKLKFQPVAILWTNDKPAEAIQFKEGRWGCVASLMAAAARGRTTVADRKTYGCIGGGVGLGFGNLYEQFPGGIEYYITTGNADFCDTELGRQIEQSTPALREGERYMKNPQIGKMFLDALPIRDIPAEFVVMKPLSQVADGEKPGVVVFVVNADQLSALVIMSHYGRGPGAHVIAPFGAGCHQFALLPLAEGEIETPRGIIGMTDMSARRSTRAPLGPGMLSFAVPFKMFLELEGHVAGSFLEREVWAELTESAGE